MAETISIDNRKVAVAARLARFAAATGRPPESCPYLDADGAEGGALRRVWLSAYLRARPPAAGTVNYDGDGGTVAAAAVGEPARGLTVDEQASGADFEQIQADHDAAVAALVAALPALLAPIAASLVVAVLAELAAGTLSGALEPAEHAVEALAAAIDKAGVKLAGKSAHRARGEVKSIGLPVPAVTVDDAPIAEQAQVTARLVAQGMAAAASRTALLHNGPGVAAATVADAVRADLDALVSGDRAWVADGVSSAMWSAQDAGRQAAFEAVVAAYGDTAATWVATERIDKATCPACVEADGRRFDTLAEARTLYPRGQNVACAGRSRCRGTLIVIPAK